jgi:hypothetical protein
MEFRCVSFHQANPDIALCLLAKDLGFNYVELQTEHGQLRNDLNLPEHDPVNQMEGIRACRERLIRENKLKPLTRMGHEGELAGNHLR